MKNRLLSLVIAVTYSLSLYALPLKKAEVISDGDRGLALEWVKYIDGGCVYGATNDNNGNIYTIGVESSNMGITSKTVYNINKYSSTGTLIWTKELTSKKGDSFSTSNGNNNIVYFNNRLFLSLVSRNTTIYYENKEITTESTCYRNIFIEIDSDDGELIRSDDIYNLCERKFDFSVDENYNKIFIAIISDGEYIADGYWQDDGTGIPYDKFDGMNQTTMKTDTRTHGATDYYIAKLDKDNNLIWDFALGGVKPDYNDSLGLIRHSVIDDTLYVYMGFRNDSIDIDPDPNKEVWVYGQEWYWGWPNFGIVLIKYDISGDRPVLLGYKEHENTWFIEHNYIFSKKSKGTFMAVENPLYRIVMNGDIIHKASEPRVYATVGGDCSITIKDSIPATSGISFHSPIVYSYDDLDNLYVPRSRAQTYRIDTLPIVLNFTKDHKEYVFNEVKTQYACISKFSNMGEYLWSLMLRNLTISGECHDGQNGYFCLYGYIFERTDYTTDLNPDPNNSYIPQSTDNRFLFLYRETYRISSDPTEHGEVTVPDTFAWHGRDYEIGVTPDEGYHLEKLTANGEEIKADTDGKYYVKNVKEPICINAKFAVGAGIEDSKANNIEITPNIIDKTLTVNSSIAFTSFSLSDMNGRVLKEGTFTQDIDVSGLTPGRYQITLKNKNTSKTGTFIKR